MIQIFFCIPFNFNIFNETQGKQFREIDSEGNVSPSWSGYLFNSGLACSEMDVESKLLLGGDDKKQT